MSTRATKAERTADEVDAGADRTGAQALVEALRALDVDLVFGLPGTHNLAAWDALARSEIRVIGVRHEQTAAYAADGLARATGALGVALTTTGPGAANAIAATGEARASHSPVLVIATDIASGIRRPGVHRGALHETRDQAAMFAPVVKGALRVADPGAIGETIARAGGLALEAPAAPVYVEIATDALAARAGDDVDPANADGSVARAETIPAPDPEAIARAARLIAASERPTIWAGGGAIDAAPAIAALAERIAAPVIETYTAKGLLPPEHPCRVGVAPHLPQAGALWDRADLVLAIGTDLDGMMTQNWALPQPPQLIAINVDAHEGSKNYEPDLLLVADASAATSALARETAERGNAAELEGELESLRRSAWSDISSEEPTAAEFLKTLRDATEPDTAIFADMCIPGYWIAAMHSFAAPRQFAYPMGWGTLGFGFPASLGGALAREGPTLCVSGDGGFMFACSELATAVQEEIPITVLVVDDGGYGMLRFDQETAGLDRHGVDLHNPDFVALGHAFGVQAERVEGVGADLGDALGRHLADRSPSLIVAEASMQPPPTTSPRWYRRPR